jgi:urea transporter
MNSNSLSSILKAYSTILFLQNPLAGLVILATTMFYPNIGLSGLLAAVTGYAMTRLWQFPDYAGQIQIFNSLLVGLSLGAFYQLNVYVVGFIILGVILTTLIATVLADWLWRLDRLPVLSLPFVIVAGFMALVIRQYTERSDFMGLAETSLALFNPAVDQFFKSVGAIYFTPEPIIGLILFVVLTFYSRYIAMLAIVGYVTGYYFLTLLLFEPFPGFIVWTSFNFIMVAVALGGFFTIPGLASLAVAIVGVLFTVLLVVATKDLLLVEGLPIMAIAYATTTLIVIVAMKKRLGLTIPQLAPEPGLPEANYEKARLAKYRNGEINSVPLLAPVIGTWTIYQGFNGKHTHKAPWQHALDFIITDNDISFHDGGDQLDDYYCFGAPVISPAEGDVVRCYDRLDDNRPGDVDAKNNWGNFIIIRLDSGLHLLLAHLRRDSIKVKEGDRVKPGKRLAACGNSGRSPQPHLHLQVQQNAELGSPTYPFHLCSMMLRKKDGSLEYKVVSIPSEGEQIASTSTDDQLANQLHLPVGRKLSYLYGSNKSRKKNTGSLTVILTLLGQFRLHSESGASAAFEENNGVLAFYDRKGPKDLLLDMWVLANGLTPLTKNAHHWRDAPSALLLPMSMLEKLWLYILRPLGCGLSSLYTRDWDNEKSNWVQKANHTLQLGSLSKQAETISIFDPVVGCKDLYLKCGELNWHAELSETGMIEDQGIPQWSKQINTGAKHEVR